MNNRFFALVKDHLFQNFVLVTAFIAFSFPSGNYHVFSGLPFQHSHEYTWFVIFLPFIFSRRVRRMYQVVLVQRNGKVGRIVFGVSTLALTLKIVVFAFGVNDGFQACYRSLPESLPNEQCERSYENFLFQENITRFDKQLNFTSNRRGITTSVANIREGYIENWHLSFFNSGRFNYSPDIEGNIWRQRLPFSANWSGEIVVQDEQILQLSYTGEGEISLDNKVFIMSPSYAEEIIIEMPVDRGIHYLQVEYIFDDGYRIGDSVVPGPYAHFVVQDSDDVSLQAAPVNLFWHIVGWLIDGSLVVIFLSIVPIYVRHLKNHWFGLMMAIITVIVATRYNWFIAKNLSHEICVFFILIFCCSIVYFRLSKKQGKILSAYVVFFSLGLARVIIDIGDIEQVIYHTAGDDWLTYESFGRSILETGSLEAGESIFRHETFIRYIKFFEHILLGDGDGWTSSFFIGALNFGVFYFFDRLYTQGVLSFSKKLLLLGIELNVFLLMNLEIVVKFIYKDASEVPPWVALPMILALLTLSSKSGKWLLGTVLLGFSAITRSTYLPAMGFVFFVFLVILIRKQKHLLVLFQYSLVIMVILLLPLVHNLYYGGKAVLFRETEQI
ncbi:MAG: hypothetical protein HN413_15805, partial [Chloroflexi bacterium]|nr:hypothetical protein [Chloroflexota bacterium]